MNLVYVKFYDENFDRIEVESHDIPLDKGEQIRSEKFKAYNPGCIVIFEMDHFLRDQISGECYYVAVLVDIIYSGWVLD